MTMTHDPPSSPLPADLLRPIASLAAEIHNALGYTQRHDPVDYAASRVERQYQSFQRHRHRHAEARRRGWDAAFRQTRGELLHHLDGLRYAVADAYAAVLNTTMAGSVSMARIFDDLLALTSWPGFEFDPKGRSISAVTESVELEGIVLGRFRIRFDYGSLLQGRVDGSLFKLDALDPNPAEGEESITHPHVRDGDPCLGDATMPIQTALKQGRIGDAFDLLERVLHTYNESSPYRRLDEWQSLCCDSCGERTPGEDLSSCSRCGHGLCNHCESSCDGCDDVFCHSCLTRTVDGERSVCRECRGRCTACDGIEVQSTLDEHDGLCAACSEAALDDEDAEAPEEDSKDASPATLSNASPVTPLP